MAFSNRLRACAAFYENKLIEEVCFTFILTNLNLQ